MKPIGRHVAETYTNEKLTLIRARSNGPDAVIELSSDEMYDLFDYWHQVRPPPTVEGLQAILDANVPREEYPDHGPTDPWRTSGAKS